jgi:hypothetical protein
MIAQSFIRDLCFNFPFNAQDITVLVMAESEGLARQIVGDEDADQIQ